jgi:hypothetical protein
MELSAARLLEFVGGQEELKIKLTASLTYYKGAMIVLKPTTGYGALPTDTAAEEAVGVLTGFYENGVRDDAYAPGAVNVDAIVKRGKVWLAVSGCAQTDVGKIYYPSDDNTMTTTAGTKTVGLRALAFKTGFLLFDLRNSIKVA